MANLVVPRERPIERPGRKTPNLDDFQDIALFEQGGPAPFGAEPHLSSSPSASFSSDSESSLPALTDTSSLRSSLSSLSSPALSCGTGPFGPRRSSLPSHVSPDANSPTPKAIAAKPGASHGPFLHDTTSMASMSRLPSFRSRSRRQREKDFENDMGDDFMPGDCFMFNVPMSPALYAKQRAQQSQSQSQSLSHNQNGSIQVMKRTDNQRNSLPRKPTSLPSIDEFGSAARAHGPGKRLPHRSHGPHGPPRASRPRAPQGVRRQVSLPELDRDAEEVSMAYLNSDLKFDDSKPSRTMSMPQLNAVRPKLHLHADDSNVSLGQVSIKSSSSLTRPEHLPPKTPEEERRHLDEYKRLLEHAAAAEQTRKKAERRISERLVSEKKSDCNVWNEWVANPRAKRPNGPGLRAMWWRGIPDKARGSVWLKATGLGRPASVRLGNTELRGDVSAIVADTELPWPELGIFGAGRPLHESLVTVVRRFLGCQPHISYSSALTRIAALLLLHMEEDDAARMLCNITDDTLPGAILAGDEQTAMAHYATYLKVFRAKFPKLSHHFNTIHISPQKYLDPMIGSLFCDRLTAEAAARIMDIFVFEGDAFLLRAALGIVRLREHALFQGRDEVLAELAVIPPTSEDTLTKTIRDITRT